jgi:hypothetical protein
VRVHHPLQQFPLELHRKFGRQLPATCPTHWLKMQLSCCCSHRLPSAVRHTQRCYW